MQQIENNENRQPEDVLGTASGDDQTKGFDWSRRNLLGAGMVTALGASTEGFAAPGQPLSSAQSKDGMIHINKTYRALVRRGLEGPAKIEKVKLLPFGGRQVLVRNTAEHGCYTDVRKVLGPTVEGSQVSRGWPAICGHEGLGVVEAIGPEVKGVKPGDKVFISTTPQCGWCYNCVRGRADACMANSSSMEPVAEAMDGVRLRQEGGIGGIAEYTVSYEERLTPYFSNLPDEEIALLTCVGSTGLGMTCTLHPIESGSSVVVFGAGPIGLSAVQGARIQGATKIISVEPIAARRQLALKLGATMAVDPNQYEGDQLVNLLRDLTKGPTDRIFVGGQNWARGDGGPDYVIEAVGCTRLQPKVEVSKDPTGLEAVQQVWNLVPRTGWGMTCGWGYPADAEVKFPANTFTNGSKTLCSCQNGGIQSRRDLPRFIRLIEDGKYDAKSMITNVYKFDDVMKCYQEIADRTVIANVIKFDA